VIKLLRGSKKLGEKNKKEQRLIVFVQLGQKITSTRSLGRNVKDEANKLEE